MKNLAESQNCLGKYNLQKGFCNFLIDDNGGYYCCQCSPGRSDEGIEEGLISRLLAKKELSLSKGAALFFIILVYFVDSS